MRFFLEGRPTFSSACRVTMKMILSRYSSRCNALLGTYSSYQKKFVATMLRSLSRYTRIFPLISKHHPKHRHPPKWRQWQQLPNKQQPYSSMIVTCSGCLDCWRYHRHQPLYAHQQSLWRLPQLTFSGGVRRSLSSSSSSSTTTSSWTKFSNDWNATLAKHPQESLMTFLSVKSTTWLTLYWSLSMVRIE